LRVRGGAGGRYEILTFVNLSEGNFVTLDGTPYRGTLEVFQSGDGVTAVNELGMEDYLPGVVGAELGRRSSNERAAVEAQAIASRTYALRNLGRFAADGFDITAGVSDQAYGGVAVETEIVRRAVQATAGLVLTYRGEPLHAFFHSTCGFATAAPDESFRSVRPQPYLRSVSDRKPGGYYCDVSPQFRWRVEWDRQSLVDILRRTLPQALGVESQSVDQIETVSVRRTGPSGRATEVRVRVGRGDIPVFGPDVRAVFATPEGRPLGSTAIQLSEQREGGRLTGLVAAGAGWGHGVGMCQWGAIGRARAGQNARTILTTYFSGATIERWY
jgi:stage II sporulation protein D